MNFLLHDLFLVLIPILPVLAVFWMLFIHYKRHHGQSINWFRLFAFSFLFLYLVDIFWNTGSIDFSAFPLKVRGNVNLIPLKGIIKMANAIIISENPWSIVNLFGNVLLFIPLGFLVPTLFQKLAKFWKTVSFGFTLSLLIETWQLFLPRASDVDDLILNTLGTVLGYLLYMLIKTAFPKIIKRIRN